MKIKNKIFTTILTVFASFIFTVPAFATTQDDVNKANEKVNNTQASISAIAIRYNKAQQDLEDLKSEIKIAENQIKETKEQIALVKGLISDKISKVYTESKQYEQLSPKKSLKQEEKQYLTETIVGSEEELLTKMAYLEESLAEQQKLLENKKIKQDKIIKQLVIEKNRLETALDEARKNQANISEQLKKEEAAKKAAEESRKQQQKAATNYTKTGVYTPPPVVKGTGLFLFPANGPITSWFGPRNCTGCSRYHQGIDIGASYGSPIYAAADGYVIISSYGSNGGYGNRVQISHGNGIVTHYAHQSSLAVSAGQYVAKGQVIGYVGDSGGDYAPHLHFEVIVNGVPVNPMAYL